MPFSARRAPTRDPPLRDMNVTSFIDVLLVLLIMFIMVIPIATHALLVPVPTGMPPLEMREENVVRIDPQDRLFWNGQNLTREGLLNQLAGAAAMDGQPVIRFEPDGLASYETSARTIALIKDSGVERFAFVGNHQYRNFSSSR